MKRFIYLALFSIIFNLYGCKSINSSVENNVEVEFLTTEGTFKVFLFNETPKHKANFIKMVENKFYDSLLFHRVIKYFVIQAGDPESKTAEPGKLYGEKSGGEKVPPEFLPQFKHVRGALGAARKSDMINPEKLSSGSHFYIVLGGMEVSDEIIYNTESRLGYKLGQNIVDSYKKHGGTPHLDGEYTIYGYVTEGMDIIDKIAKEKTDNNNRPLKDVKIIKTKIIELSESETAEKYSNYAK